MFTRLTPATLIVASVALCTLTACGPKIRLADEVDDNFELDSSQRYDGRLHSPYVAGSTFEIYAYDITRENDLNGWTIVSLDPDVMDITSVEVIRDDLDRTDDKPAKTDVIVAQAEATGPGTAILEVHDHNGTFVRATEVEVMQPDRLELRAAGPLFIGDDDDIPSLVDTTPKILANGSATFLVEWFAGEQVLGGGGALSMNSDNPNTQTFLAIDEHLNEHREWARLAFGYPEDGEEFANIEFSANGLPVQTVEFEIVSPEDISYIDIVGTGESGAEERELLAVLAQAFDMDDEAIWGVAFDWDIDGDTEPEEGDLFRYWFEQGVDSTLGAQYGDSRGEIVIQGDEGFVDSSNDNPTGTPCSCSTSGDTPGRGIGFGLLTLGALGLVRRKRSV